MNKIIITISVITLLLSIGCTRSSGILELSKNTYNISTEAAPIDGGVIGAKREALTQASKYCQSMGKVIFVQNWQTQSISSGFSTGMADLTFSCVSPEEQPIGQYEQNPNIVIQHK